MSSVRDKTHKLILLEQSSSRYTFAKRIMYGFSVLTRIIIYHRIKNIKIFSKYGCENTLKIILIKVERITAAKATLKPNESMF